MRDEEQFEQLKKRNMRKRRRRGERNTSQLPVDASHDLEIKSSQSTFLSLLPRDFLQGLVAQTQADERAKRREKIKKKMRDAINVCETRTRRQDTSRLLMMMMFL